MTARLDLARWTVRNPSFTAFIMFLCLAAGYWSFDRLGQSEDPPFTFKIMFIRAYWPGATAGQVADQVTSRIERAVMQSGKLQYVRSYSMPGESVVLVMAQDTMHTRDLPAFWYDLRKKVGDVRHRLPNGVQGPFFNDEYGDTFGNIYALVAPGVESRLVQEAARQLEDRLRDTPGVARIETFGIQDERIWVELSNAEMTRLGVSMASVQEALAKQVVIIGTGTLETTADRVSVQVSGGESSAASLGELPLPGSDGQIRLRDIATLRRGTVDPPQPHLRVDGQPALAVGVSMAPGSDIVDLGKALDSAVDDERALLPLGIDIVKIADQPSSVVAAISEFLRTLAEALLVVLAVTFLALGVREGFVVALSIPLVLAITFTAMHWLGIGLHKISLGALVLALGLLVDDAIIAIESMAVRLANGDSPIDAAAGSLQSTAIPMLTGTLLTAAGLLPIATAESTTGEFTRAMFQVVVISLLISWVVAVAFIPLLGYWLLPARVARRASSGGSVRKRSWVGRMSAYTLGRYTRVLEWSLHHPLPVIGAALLALAIAGAGFQLVPKQFFPNSTRLELVIDLELTDGSSSRATARAVAQAEDILRELPGVLRFACFVASGAPRFYLPMDQKIARPNIGQCIVHTPDIDQREGVRAILQDRLNTAIPYAQPRVLRLENGPPVGFPVQYRISGPSPQQALKYGKQLAAKVATHPQLRNVDLDWAEESKVLHVAVDVERVAAAGSSVAQVKAAIDGALTGRVVAQLYEGEYAVPVVARSAEADRVAIELESLTLDGPNGTRIPLAGIATISYGFEPGTLWHRNGKPTVTIRADVVDGITPASAVASLRPDIDSFASGLAAGYHLEVGGAVEDSARGARSVAKGVPLMLVVMALLIMIQHRRIRALLIVLATAPLGLIGVTASMVLTQAPFGFVAMLGVIAMSGMIMRNTVILIDRIDSGIAEGLSQHRAIVLAALSRTRPIVLTSLTAILAMVPLSRSDFFGPMAVAIAGGLLGATVLTLLVVPALYEALHRQSPRVANASMEAPL